jgi:ketosteroid isomerase-like protein
MLRTVVLLALALPLLAATPDSEIRKVLDDQALAWNRGDIPAFMTGYEDSPNTTFVGTDITKGYAAVLDRYKTKYSSKEKMGTLRFSGVEVQLLGIAYASVTGRFHLDRTKEAGGEASGIFTLVFKKTAGGWKIIVDHTS